jgi:hypothetical protein
MRDRDIRAALWKMLDEEHAGDPDTLVLDELGVCQGEARADVAVVNGTLAAFEIKSDRDTLARLPGQVEAYQRVFDSVTIIVGGKYVGRIVDVVPASWGIMQAIETGGAVHLDCVRRPDRNESVDPFSLSQLLWRDEALSVLEEREIDKGLRSKPRRALWRAIADHLSPEEVSEAVRHRLKVREGWRSDPRQRLDGDSPPPAST